MATRHQARESVVGLLYALDLGNDEIAEFAEDILEDKKIRNKQREFALTLFKGVVENKDMIDKTISTHLTDWNLNRIGSVEKAILRLATYEVVYLGVDNAIIINEAIELSKELCTEKSSKFINGVLDAIAKDGKNVSTKESKPQEDTPNEEPKEEVKAEDEK
jgi:N utilization substance protein B